jgi:FdhD protein
MNVDDLPGAGPACVPMDVRRVQADSVEAAQDHVAEETPIALVYNGQPFAVMLGTPLDLEDFALGFTWTEGIIASLEEFQGVEVEAEDTGFSVYVSVPHERVEALAARRRSLTGRTGCGLCGRQMLEDALRPVAPVPRSGPVPADVVVTSRASYEMVQKTASAGIGILSAVSAPTALAVRTARAAGLRLLGFSRGRRHTVYAPAIDSP